MRNGNIPLVLNMKLVEFGIHQWILWNPQKTPHVVIVGATGSGKSYMSLLLLAKIGLYYNNAELIVCDYKYSNDFIFLNGKQNYYTFKECKNGIDEFYRRFIARQNKTDMEKKPIFLFFDEYAAFINSFDDKKNADIYKNKIAEISMLGRSFQVHLIIALQRADAEFFKTGRDNFTLRIGLGNLSVESSKMLFSEYTEQMKSNKGVGKGYLSDIENFYEIIVPRIKDMNSVYQSISKIVF